MHLRHSFISHSCCCCCVKAMLCFSSQSVLKTKTWTYSFIQHFVFNKKEKLRDKRHIRKWKKRVALTLFNNKVLNLAVFAQDYVIKPRIYSGVSVSVLAPDCEALGKMAKATKECVSTEETTLFFLRNFVSHCLHVRLLSLDLWRCVCVCVRLPACVMHFSWLP